MQCEILGTIKPVLPDIPRSVVALLFDREGRRDTPRQVQTIESFFVDLHDAEPRHDPRRHRSIESLFRI